MKVSVVKSRTDVFGEKLFCVTYLDFSNASAYLESRSDASIGDVNFSIIFYSDKTGIWSKDGSQSIINKRPMNVKVYKCLISNQVICVINN